jgi:hypothetical protein
MARPVLASAVLVLRLFQGPLRLLRLSRSALGALASAAQACGFPRCAPSAEPSNHLRAFLFRIPMAETPCVETKAAPLRALSDPLGKTATRTKHIHSHFRQSRKTCSQPCHLALKQGRCWTALLQGRCEI